MNSMLLKVIIVKPSCLSPIGFYLRVAMQGRLFTNIMLSSAVNDILDLDKIDTDEFFDFSNTKKSTNACQVEVNLNYNGGLEFPCGNKI